MKIAFHAINGVGLGHLVRSLALATEVRAIDRSAEILVVTTAHDTSLLDDAGVDYVKLPPRLGEPHADPQRSLAALPEMLEEPALQGVLDAFDPDLVVFDTHAPMSVVRRLASRGARSVLVLRELRPEALRGFVKSGAPREFDRIVVPHDPSEVKLDALQGYPVDVVGAVVANRARGAAKAGSRAALGSVRKIADNGPLVLAVAGGGGQPVDARRYLRAVADAHCLARARIPNLRTVLVLGPYGRAPDHLHRFEGLDVRAGVTDLAPLMKKAALVVSQAGYNAVAEIRAHRAASVLVPGFRKAEDQRARALRLSRIGASVIAKPEARSIADELEKLLLGEGALEAMREAHHAAPLVPQNRSAAQSILRPLFRSLGPVKKVALVAHDFAPRLGGMETVARSLAKGLIARGIEVRVYTADRLGARVASGLPEGVVRPIYPMLPGARRIDLTTDLYATINAASVDTPDVIHLCHAGLGPWIPALRAALPSRVTAHVHGNDLLAPWVHHAMSTESFREASVAGLSQADAVFSVSRFSGELAKAAGVSSARLRVVENGVDTERFCPGARDRELAARWGIDADEQVLLCVSRLARRKGHLALLQAVAALRAAWPRLQLVFTGVNEALSRVLVETAESLGIARRILPIGFVSDDELPSIYRLADAFALVPDRLGQDDVEGFGVALLEAAATAIPTIGTRVGGVPEAIADGETGLLVDLVDGAASVPELARAIDRLLRDPAAARAMGRRGRQRAIDRFSESRVTDHILSTWTKLCGADRLAKRDGVELVRTAARQEATARDARAKRKEDMASLVARGRIIRIRATGNGAVRLPAALADADELSIRPRVEVKLRRFLEADFTKYALPFVDSVELVHGVPHVDALSLFEKLERANDGLAKVRSLRLFLSEEARHSGALALSAVPEIHALRRLFRDRGAVVVPPPELMRYLSETPAGGPETAMIEPTNLCNLACPTCPTGTGKIKPLPQMTLTRFQKAVEELGPQVRNLALWNYGEPLLNRELPKMIAHAKAAGVGVVKVSSNVHFLDGERGRALLGSGLDVLILSVDGASQATYATFRKDGDFERVASAVARLCAEKKRLGLTKPRIELQFIAMRHNEHELPEMHRLASEWGVDKLRVKTVGADDEENRHLIPKARLLSRYDAEAREPNTRHAFCTMAWDHAVINVDGAVTPCCYLRPDMGAEMVMGNVFESSFAEIWRGAKYRAFRARMLDGRKDMPVCSRCRGGTHDLLAAVYEVPKT